MSIIVDPAGTPTIYRSAPELSVCALAAAGSNFATAAQLEAFTDHNVVEISTGAAGQGYALPDAPIGTLFEFQQAGISDFPILYLPNGSVLANAGVWSGASIRFARSLIGGWRFW